MPHLRVFVFKDSNDNRMEFTAPSKTKARKRLGSVHPDPSSFEYVGEREETQEEFVARIGRERKRAVELRDKQATTPRLVRRRKAFGRNDRCPCGSGKKVKHCRCSRG